MTVCADCGREIERDPLDGRWFNWTDFVRNVGRGRSYVCRMKYMDGTNNIVRSCDYHYVEGETQRHYPQKESP